MFRRPSHAPREGRSPEDVARRTVSTVPKASRGSLFFRYFWALRFGMAFAKRPLMKSHVALAAALVSASALLASTDAVASNYPPSYDYCSARYTRTSGPFEIVQDWIQHDDANLTVAYRGYLRNYFPDNEINFYIRLNGNDAFVPASAGSNNDAYVLVHSGAYDCTYCAPYYGGLCDGQSGWVCSWPNATEDHLMFWAWNNTSANAWDVEVAAESHGYWDSNYGQNFKARFDQAACY